MKILSALVAGGAAAAAVGLVRSGYERRHFVVEETSIYSEKIRNPRTLVFLTDLHDKEFGEANSQLLGSIRTIRPDLILIGGDIMVATNAQARKARALFEETEGIDIYSAAGIATASLVKSVADGRIDPEKIVMLNITGGGEHRCQQDKELWYLEPSLVFPLTPDPEEVVAKTEALFD